MTSQIDVLPGDVISPDLIPRSEKKQLKLGAGLTFTPPSTIKANVAGALKADYRKNAVWVEYGGGRYIPRLNDKIIGIIHHTSADTFHVTITPHAPLATLPQLAFEGATKKTRPMLQSGDLVYARVSAVSSYLDAVELECVSATTGKADDLGPLKEGMLFDVGLGMSRKLLNGKKDGCVVLDALGERIGFEAATGRNGRVWIKSAEVQHVIVVGRAIQETERLELDEKAQRKLVEKLLREL